MRLGIEFGKSHCRREPSRGFGKGRRHHLAGPTPRCPEIHHYRQIVAGHEAIEVNRRQLDRRALQQSCAAGTAFRRFIEPGPRYTVDAAAGGAGNVYGVGVLVHVVDFPEIDVWGDMRIRARVFQYLIKSPVPQI
jgi:hypothetical protein